MDEMEIGMAVASKIPLWLEVFSGFMLALGGLEFLKWAGHHIANWRAERRKNSAEAKQEEAVAHQQAATAGQQDADWRQKELELMTQFVHTAKEQYEDLTRRYEDLKAEKEEDRGIKASLRREINELKLEQSEQWRIVTGIQKEWTRLVAQKQDAERHYCGDEACTRRKPKLGEYQTVTPDFNSLIRPRDKKTGRFVKTTPSTV